MRLTGGAHLDVLKRDFVEHLKNEESYGYRQYLNRGTAGKLVQNLLLQFKVKKLLPPENQVFEEWMEEQSGAQTRILRPHSTWVHVNFVR